VDEVFRRADEEMYRIKRAGKVSLEQDTPPPARCESCPVTARI
jgi:hypothetical protein